MGALKTFGYAIVFSSLTANLAEASDVLLNRVTECVGRMSAQIEHHWMFAETSTTEIERQRDHLLDILEALVTSDNAKSALAARINAKAAHASLLTQAAFARDGRQSKWAETRADRQLALCRDILLTPPKSDAILTSSPKQNDPQTQNQETWQASQ
ncbi:hypothetical protein [Marivita sp.]|uniref:hypothetical protein n=1 Tax=Marivita sp. TaxID=2003365 RepID=UPI003F6A64C7